MVRHGVVAGLLALAALFPMMGAECAGTGPALDPGSTNSNVSQTGDEDSPPGDNGNTNAGDDPVPTPDDGGDSAQEAELAQVEEFLKAKVLTEISTSSNIGDISFIEHFRGDTKLCSNKTFSYFEFKETTIGGVFSRREFSAQGHWSVKLDAANNQVLLVLEFDRVSEGNPFTSELPIVRNEAGETFLGGTRVFVTEGDDVCG